MTIMYPYYGNGFVEPEQLQLFDPDEYLGLDGMWHITVDLEDEVIEWCEEEARKANMDFNSFVVKTLMDYVTKLEKEDHGKKS